MTATDMVSVFTYGNSRVRMRLDFTDDHAALVKVIDDLEQAQIDAERHLRPRRLPFRIWRGR
jgi:hypothetical protein